ncbi:hypothetical protein DACRYDRAFT_23672 [Dacryopinax primogenitus]|uniref:tRNA ligase n=1 Tax=Dacryopinax primogenitus (strain DJM 731) TaxID=1858805 RepID=M5G174_DACPD|nr:uncharacterized protein DACRYDRAFT_23672 [Dacryopinax primogenitus]EJT99576.1 hypothetical protein DACRYDRAFT_23672 [Dacryopinax primogenitus]
MTTEPLPTPHLSPAVEHVLQARDPTKELISELRGMAIDEPKLVKATQQKVHPPRPGAPPAPANDPPAPEFITSWKMLEHLYRQSPCPFPSLARGLFTTWTSESGVPEPNIKGEKKGQYRERVKDEVGGTWRIVARGYDKFFNVGEVGWTEWGSLAANTEGPYELTLKSNGCLILVAALTPSRLLVTSKHSLGTRKAKGSVAEDGNEAEAKDDEEELMETPANGSLGISHAERGEEWLYAHLKRVGKTEADLAKVLWERNISAVAELCDDSFEEHVLPIPTDLIGLVLHGLVPNSPSFQSLPAHEVADFARQWGFRPTQIVTVNSIKEVMDFCREGAKKGEWEGIGVEGWVVRCHVHDPNVGKTDAVDELADAVANLVIADPGDAPVKQDKKGKATKTPPYPPGAPFFFKVKFEEPYLMYREWRELTKVLLPVIDGAPVEGVPETQNSRHARGKAAAKPVKIGDRFKRRPETRVYLKWVLKEMLSHPGLFRNYRFNRGIIETREKFLEWAATPGEGKEIWEREVDRTVGQAATEPERHLEEQKKAAEEPKHWKKTIIVPVAIPGCGKTSVAIALKELFGIGHTQSDDVKTKKATGPQFLKNITALLETNDVVFADRNNHLEQHRQQLREVAEKCPGGPARLVALNWGNPAVPVSTLHRLMSARLLARGENHQSLRAKKDDLSFHEDVLWKFISSAEPLDEDEVDEAVMMDPRDELEGNIRRAVELLAPIMGWEMPTDEKLKAAIEVARDYKAGARTKEDAEAGKKKKVQYYAILAELDLPALLGALLTAKSVDPGLTKFWEHLTSTGRVNKRPHVTLVHANDDTIPEKATFWDACAQVASSPTPPRYEFVISHVLTDGKVMALVVDPDSVRVQTQGGSAEWPSGPGWDGDRVKMLHITVGTQGDKVKNVEGGRLVRAWREGKTGGVSVYAFEEGKKVRGVLKGFSY